jgi:cytochrome c oxidase subunit III
MSAKAAAPAAHAGGHHGHDEPHLPHGSIWPFVLAIGIAILGTGLILFGNSLRADAIVPFVPAVAVLGLGLAAVVGAFLGWFREDHKWWWENVGTGTHIPKVGVLVFISSEVFLFGALFSNYFTFQDIADTAGTAWPDAPGLHLPLLKTGIFSLFLFASSATIHVAEGHLRAGRHRPFVQWWGLTVLLGAIFLGGQVWEYATLIHEGHTLGSSQFMTAFYILTGTHGLHVFGGLCILLVMFVRAAKGQFTPQRHAGPQVAAIYWHFVDLVWVFVFTVLYVLPSVGLA